MIWRQKYGSRKSPTTKSSASLSENSGNFRSTPRTKKPSDLRRLTRCPPIKPPAPHTKAVLKRISLPCRGPTLFPQVIPTIRSVPEDNFSPNHALSLSIRAKVVRQASNSRPCRDEWPPRAGCAQDRPGLCLRPQGRAPLEPFHRLPSRRGGAYRCRSARRELLAAPGDVSGDDRVLRFEGAVLAIAVDLPDRHRGRGRNGADQLRRQCRRLYGPLCHMDSTGSFDNG